jgi:hypothetical protein
MCFPPRLRIASPRYLSVSFPCLLSSLISQSYLDICELSCSVRLTTHDSDRRITTAITSRVRGECLLYLDRSGYTGVPRFQRHDQHSSREQPRGAIERVRRLSFFLKQPWKYTMAFTQGSRYRYQTVTVDRSTALPRVWTLALLFLRFDAKRAQRGSVGVGAFAGAHCTCGRTART